MAGLGIHKKGHGKEKIQGHKVHHHKAKDLQMGDQMDQHPMTSPVHPDLTSMAGGPSMPSSTEAASADINPMAGATQDASAMGGSSAGASPFKKGGRVKRK